MRDASQCAEQLGSRVNCPDPHTAVVTVHARASPSVVMRFHASIAFATILVVSFAPGVHANKGSAMCGAYLTTVDPAILADPTASPVDYSACKYGHMSVNDPSPAGKGCFSKPGGKCELCTRAQKYGDVRNHTCACITEAQRTKVRDRIKDSRLALGGVLLGMGALWLAHSVWVMTDEDRVERRSLASRDACGPGTYSAVNFVHFIFLPLALCAAGAAIVGVYSADDSSYFNGCCMGYETCTV